jgi:hypothetical protein
LDVDSLGRLLNARDQKLQKAADQALSNITFDSQGKLIPGYIRLLGSHSDRVRIAGIRGCRILKASTAVPKIRSILKHQVPHKWIKLNIYLPPVGEETFVLENEAMEALIDLGDERSIDEILSRDELIFGGVATSDLAEKFGAKVLPKLVTMLKKHPNEMRKSAANTGIISIRDPEAFPLLAGYLRDPELHTVSFHALATISGVSPKAKEFMEGQYGAFSFQEKSTFLVGVLNGLPGWGTGKSVVIDPDIMGKIKELLGQPMDTDMVPILVTSRNPSVIPILEKYLQDAKPPFQDISLDNRVLAAWGLTLLTGNLHPVPCRDFEAKMAEIDWDNENVYNMNSSINLAFPGTKVYVYSNGGWHEYSF